MINNPTQPPLNNALGGIGYSWEERAGCSRKRRGGREWEMARDEKNNNNKKTTANCKMESDINHALDYLLFLIKHT